MEVAGDLAVRPCRFVTKGQRPHLHLVGNRAADLAWQGWIVIAGDPYPVTSGLQFGQRSTIGRIETLMRGAVVKAVAEGDHRARIMARKHRARFFQRRYSIVRWQ